MPMLSTAHKTASQLINETMNSPATSSWFKTSLALALGRDCLDAANDAEMLSTILRLRADEILNGGYKGR